MISQKIGRNSNKITKLILIFLLIVSLTFIVRESLNFDDNSSGSSNSLITESAGFEGLTCSSGTNCPGSFPNGGIESLTCSSGTNCPG